MRDSFVLNVILFLLSFSMNYYFAYANVRHIYKHSTTIPDPRLTIEQNGAHDAPNKDGYPATSNFSRSNTQGYMRNLRVVHDNQMALSGTNNLKGKQITSNDAHPEIARSLFLAESNFISTVYSNVDETSQNKIQSLSRARSPVYSNVDETTNNKIQSLGSARSPVYSNVDETTQNKIQSVIRARSPVYSNVDETTQNKIQSLSRARSPVYSNVDETTQNKIQSLGRAKRSKRRENRFVKHLARAFDIPGELYQRTPDLIRRYGYPVEEHYVTTADGYIIAVHRIPATRLPSEGAANPNVVLLMSCGICSSADYVHGDPGHSLGFVLASAGYDVWLGNVRGNFYGRNHTKLNPDTDRRFWRFSYDEIAKFDLPAQVSFVRRHTGVDKIFYVGHSSSTLTFFMSAAGPNSFADKVRLMVAMSPIAYRGNTMGLMAISMQLMALLQVPLETMGTGELYQRSPLLNSLLYMLCSERSVIHDTCVSIFTSLTGGHNKGLFDKRKLPTILAHMLSGASARMVAHLGQLITAPGLQMFDFGPRKNMLHYGRPTPPLYSVAAITCPTLLYWSSNDKPNSPKDVARLAAELPNLVRSTRVNDSTFGHLDSIFAESARTLIYEDMLQVMRSY